MLRILETGANLPWSVPISPAATFAAGTAMTLTVLGSQVYATPSDGLSFFGVADDVKTNTFSAVSWDEEITTGIINPLLITTNGSNQKITTADIKVELQNPNVDPNYFISNPVEVELIPRNGVIVFPAGTVLDYDLGGSGTPDSIKTLCRYTYQIPNVIGEDTTRGSQMCTIFFARMIFEVDTFETNQSYIVMGNIYINQTGLFTSRKIYPNSPAVAICLAPPSTMSPNLQLMLL